MNAPVEHAGLRQAHEDRLLDRLAASTHGVVSAFGHPGQERRPAAEPPGPVAASAEWRGPAAEAFRAADQQQSHAIAGLHAAHDQRHQLQSEADAVHAHGARKTNDAWRGWQENDKKAAALANTPWGRDAQFAVAHKAAQAINDTGRAVHQSHQHTAQQVKDIPHKRKHHGRKHGHHGKHDHGTPAAAAVGGPHGSGADACRRYMEEALDKKGVHDPRARARWMAGYMTLMERESGFKVEAANNWDSNARAGMASQGLCQLIPSTFKAHHEPGTSTNIHDPVANICASMNYVMSRWHVSHDGSNLAANVQQADPRRPPKGY